MTKVYIVRHGNTFDKGDIVTRVGARTDLPLSSSGLAQANALATHFRARVPGGFEKVFCSPLVRTRQTAECILASYDDQPCLEELEFLREVDYGPDENQPEPMVIARIGEAALSEWEANATPPPGWDVNPQEIKRAWRDMFVGLSGGPVLIVTSNGIARFALDTISRFDIHPDSIKLKTGAYGEIMISDEAIALTQWNVRP